ncbi:SMI1/KNR4 family protein [Variovorax guangxiensis]|nr:SMI1/KNR4 family protein [Variovorax guangxiensis]
MPSIRDLADQHPELFRGDRKETVDRLRAVEKALDVRLPPDVRWLLLECGYGAVHAVSNIQQSIDDTFRFRASAGLDPRYVVLDDKGDAGVVLLDTSDESGPVVWADWRSAGLLHTGTSDSELFKSFSAWVEDRILDLGDE